MSSPFFRDQSLQAEVIVLRGRLAALEDVQQTLERTQAALAASELQLAQMFDTSSVIKLIVEPDTWRIIDANAAACRFYGYSAAELKALQVTALSALSPAETAERMLAGMAEHSDRFELRHRLRSGDIRDVEAYITPLSYGGQPMLFCIIHDITGHKEVETQRRHQRDYLTALHETTLAMLQHIELEQLLQTMLWQATTLMGSKHGAIYQISDDGTQLLQTTTRGTAEAHLAVRITPGEGAVGQAWNSGQTLVIDDYTHWKSHFNLQSPDAIHALVVTPLHSSGQITGMIVVAHLSTHHHFTAEQVAILKQFARLASLALEKARFYTAAQAELAERRRVEAILRQVNERFELVEEVINGGIYDRDLRTLTTTVTPGFTRAFGYTSAQIDANPAWWEERIHPGDWPLLNAQMLHALERDDSLRLTYRFRTQSNVYRYVQDTAQIVRDDSGTAVRMVGSMADVTEQHEAEIALQESEERYRRLVEASPIPIIVYQHNIIVYVNTAALDLAHARDPAEMIGKSLFDYVHPDNLSLMHIHVSHFEQRRSHFTEARFFRLDGKVIDVEFSGIIIRFKGQLAIQIVARDITERKRAEATLRDSEERYRRLVEMAPMPLIVHRRGIILYANLRALELACVVAPHGLVGKSLLTFVHPDAQAELSARLRHPVNQSSSGETCCVVANGTALDVEFSVSTISYAGKSATQVIINDITGRKQAEQERLLLERRLLETQKLESLGVLAGGIAHDFNNLLVSMLGNASLALLELAPDAPARETIGRIEQAAKRAAELTNQMLAYSGRGLFIMQPIDLNTLIEESVPLFSRMIRNPAEFEYLLPARGPLIEGDAAQLRQVLVNLVVNAVDAAGDQPARVQIRAGWIEAEHALFEQGYLVTELAPGRYGFVEVVDAGCGMSAETVTKMFDPFFTTKFTGRGLGLAATLGIVRAHSGSILVASQLSQGTKVMVLLPAIKQPAPAALPRPKPGSAPAQHGLILIIDDEPDVREVTERILKRLGYTALLAENGQDGIALFREHADQLLGVLLDLTMPEFDGKATFQVLQQINPQVGVILMSGYNEQYVTDLFEDAGLAGFLAKPFMIDDLRAKLAVLHS